MKAAKHSGLKRRPASRPPASVGNPKKPSAAARKAADFLHAPERMKAASR